MESRRSLFISLDGLTDPLGQSQIIPYVAGLSSKGYQMHVLSAEKPERKKKEGGKIEGIAKEKGFTWHSIDYSNTIPLVSIFLMMRKYKKEIKKIHKRNQLDMIHARSYIPALLALWAKKKYQIPFLFDIRGFWPEEKVEGGAWNLKNLIYRSIYKYFKKVEQKAFEESAHIISLTHAAKKNILSRPYSGIQSQKITVIPTCVDIDLFNEEQVDPSVIEKNRTRLGIEKGQMVMSYLGSVGTVYMLNEMLDFYKKALIHYPQLIFLFISQTPKAEIEAALKIAGIKSNQYRITFAAREDLPPILLLSDFSIFFYRPGFSRLATSPTKMGELLSLGVPIVYFSKVGDVNEIFSKSGGGLGVDNYSEERLDNAVQQMDKLLSTDMKPVKKWSRDYYSLHTGIENYQNVYRTILD